MNIIQFVLQNLSLVLLGGTVLFLIMGLIWVFLLTHEDSGFRGVITYLGHVLVVVLGWSLGGWLGILLISLPILIFYYYLSFHLAMVVVPISDPDNIREWWQRFLIFVRYQWGVQYPQWMVTDSLGQNIEKRIPGNQFGSFPPGLIWARSHQVVGLTTGMTFSRVPDPGNVFTGPYESPLAVVDLRTQLRTSWIEAISSDGIPFRALLFAAFRVDKEIWDRDLYHKLLRRNPLLENAQRPDFTKGNYSFSRSRMRALFSTIGVGSHMHEHEDARIAKWDERVLFQIEKTAREVLSQRRIDELWQPKIDREGASAMDEIALEIKEGCANELRQRGVLLHASRIVNLEFQGKKVSDEGEKGNAGAVETHLIPGNIQDDHQIEQKQILAWSADWQREAAQTRAEGKAHADLLTQEARAYAYTNLLTAFAEGLEEARLLDPKLPRYVIAVRFIGALEKLMGQSDAQGVSDVHDSLDQLKKMIPWVADGD
ncbi:MAG: hypothetical protein HYR70_00625 [Chloroflexi bacterium]|nr:hypothetical protein [Chloroflexota bacterium]MBI3341375.1 hypothetical protein [Chloroflexota bacterium]